jgi:acyl-CoA synthetase (AMP-forming)/AMP-acid ligase II
MLGYYGATEARERFFRTGDLGYLDQDGRVHLTGRRKEIIIRNGKNLSPARIEQALLRLPQVKAAAVVGLPDEKAGEVPGAMAVCEGAETEDDLLQALAPLLPKNERPAALRVVKEIPLLPTGKPDKMRIRKELLQWLNRSS